MSKIMKSVERALLDAEKGKDPRKCTQSCCIWFKEEQNELKFWCKNCCVPCCGEEFNGAMGEEYEQGCGCSIPKSGDYKNLVPLYEAIPNFDELVEKILGNSNDEKDED